MARKEQMKTLMKGAKRSARLNGAGATGGLVRLDVSADIRNLALNFTPQALHP